MTPGDDASARVDAARGLALHCSDDGTVIEVIAPGLITGEALRAGASLHGLIAPDSTEKLRAFLAQLRTGASVFDWEMNALVGEGIHALRFSGVPTADGALVIGVVSHSDLLAMLEQLVAMNNELVNTVRTLTKEQTTPRPRAEADGFAELTRLNNDLVNLQRELTKKNAELERSRRMVSSIIETTPDIIYIYDVSLGRIVWSTHSVASVLGHPLDADADDARLLEEALDPETLDARRRRSAELAASPEGTVLEWEYLAHDASGEQRWLSARETVFERMQDGRVARLLGAAQDVTEQRRLLERLRELALVDELTGLYNRHGFETLAHQTVEHAARTGQRLGVLFCDLDNLKTINDTYGHADGDRVIQAAAEALRRAMRSADVIARLGGDEFVALTIETSPDGTEALRDRLHAVVERMNRQLDLPLPLEMSVGISVCDAPGTCRLQELVDAADSDMYERKHRGGRSDQ